MHNVTVPLDGDLLEILDDRRGLVPRGTLIRKLVEDWIENGGRVVLQEPKRPIRDLKM